MQPKVVRPLLKLVARSLVRILAMLWAVATVTFLAIRALPGNPVDVWVQDLQNRGLTYRQAEVMATRLLKIDVHASLWSQYVDYMRNLLHGDLRNSVILSPGTPVTQMLSGRLAWTLFSVGLSLRHRLRRRHAPRRHRRLPSRQLDRPPSSRTAAR